MPNRQTLGGIIHTYQKYDPVNLPAPTQPPPDLVSPALEHMLMFGDARRLTDEELARAIHLDPSQIRDGVGAGQGAEGISQGGEQNRAAAEAARSVPASRQRRAASRFGESVVLSRRRAFQIRAPGRAARR